MRAATEAAAGRGRVAGRALGRRGDGRPVGLIGPNAVTRMAQALEAGEGHSICLAVFADAGIARYLAEPPTRMLDEQEVARLHRALIDRLGPDRGGDVSWEAGRLTGDYLLANRIPRLVQYPVAPAAAPARRAAADPGDRAQRLDLLRQRAILLVGRAAADDAAAGIADLPPAAHARARVPLFRGDFRAPVRRFARTGRAGGRDRMRSDGRSRMPVRGHLVTRSAQRRFAATRGA